MKRRPAPLPKAPPSAFGVLPTEQRNPRSTGLDTMSAQAIVKLLLEEDRRALSAALRQVAPLARAADAFAAAFAGGGSVLFAGAGTSGRLGVLEAAECPPTFGVDPERVRASMAGGERAVFRAVEGAEDDFESGQREGRTLQRGDLLIAISASSVTPFARGTLAGARGRGAATVLVTCAKTRALATLADIVIAIATGPEALTGSTRLKAGSATKAALNAITTAAMVKLGKAYQNLMVDLRPGSVKLRDRARRIIAATTGAGPDHASQALADSQGEVKTAIVMLARGVDAVAARTLLESAGGHVRRALRLRLPSNGR